MNLTEKLSAKVLSKDASIQFDKSHTNTEYIALCNLGDRDVMVGTFLEHSGHSVDLIDRTIEAGSLVMQSIDAIAEVVISWLTRRLNVYDIQNQYPSLEINEYYIDVLTLPIDTLLEKQWMKCIRRVKKEHHFREDLISELHKKFYWLHVVFSHDVLCFSNIIDSDPKGNVYPSIYCKDNSIIISTDRTLTNYVVVSDNSKAISILTDLIPWTKQDIVGPFERNSA